MRRAEHAAPPTRPVDAAPEESRHGPIAQLLIAWSPLSGILIAYALAQWVSAPLAAGDAPTNRWGAPLHVHGPADADRAVFGAHPSVWLQSHLVDGSTHWYDTVAALVYATHLVAIPLATAVVWFTLRERFGRWVLAVLTFAVVGTAGYVAYPAAPPWLASDRGAIARVDRLSSRGWDHLHLDFASALTRAIQDGSNQIAAMPSLHAGATLLVALFLWPVASTAWRSVLVGYVLLMAFALVYTGEHYVVDVVAGWLTAAVACAVARLLPRRR